MKRLLCLLLTGAMTLSLMACGQNTESTAETQTQETATEETVAAETTEETGEVLELTMYFPVSVGGGPDALIDELCAQYHEENPNVVVKPVYAAALL